MYLLYVIFVVYIAPKIKYVNLLLREFFIFQQNDNPLKFINMNMNMKGFSSTFCSLIFLCLFVFSLTPEFFYLQQF